MMVSQAWSIWEFFHKTLTVERGELAKSVRGYIWWFRIYSDKQDICGLALRVCGHDEDGVVKASGIQVEVRQTRYTALMGGEEPEDVEWLDL